MKPSTSEWALAAVLALAAGAGCECHPYFKAGARYKITIGEALPSPDSSWTACRESPTARPQSFMAGDSFELVGAEDHGEGPWCGGEGDLWAPHGTAAWFATDALSTCSGYTCMGAQTTGCRPEAQFFARHEAPSTFSIYWQSTCGTPFRCAESYAATYAPIDP